MPSNSNGENPSSRPLGNQQDTAQQNWFELDGQKVAGETLKAKKWAAERRIVDDSSHHGNIHTGTEQSDDLDKSHTPAADLTSGLQAEQIVQPVEDHEAQVVEEVASQQNRATLSEVTGQATPESGPLSSSGDQSTGEVESVVAGRSGSDPLVFDEHFDDSSVQPGSRSAARENVDRTAEVQPASSAESENGAAASTPDPTSVTSGIERVDSSVSSEPAVVNSNPIAVDDSAVSGHQAQFDGNDTSLVADSSIIADNSEPYTVSLDITPDEQDYGYIISNGGQTHDASGFFVTRGVYGNDSSVYQIGVADENQFIIFQGGEVENGQQTNLTFTYDGQNLIVYQNGIDITDSGSITTRAGRDLPMQNVTLGAPSNVSTLYEFKGETDNVQIYDSALNAVEVAQIQTGVIPDEEGLLVHYTFEGESPLADQSGNGHDLDNRGNVQISDRVDSKLSTDEDTSLTISADTLLANDSDVDGDILTITEVSKDVIDTEGNVVGIAVQDDDGNIIFTPGDTLDAMAEGEKKDINFTYTVEDGHGGTDTATVSLRVVGTNDAPVIISTETINVTEESMEGFSGYGEIWEGDVYSIITQDEMLEHLGITDVDSDSFTVSLANANFAWHEGVAANDSVFTSDTLESGSSKYDETVVQVTQEFLDNYPTIDAEVGDFYFDHVDFDSLAEGETANIQFSVQVSDGESNSEPRNVNIEVTGSNDAPTVSATVNLQGGTEDTSVTFTASDLLVHAEDVDVGDSLTISGVSEKVVDGEGNVVGTAAQDDDGNIIFTPGDALDVLAEGESKEVQLTYTVADGHGGSASATANITIQGTDNDLTYVSESAGYRNVVGIYQNDDDGNPVSGTVLIDDQNGMVGGTHLADLEPGNYEFFIIANGAGEIDSESVISFDNSGEKPVLLIDGEAAAHPVYYTEPGFNSDDKDHFHFDSDGKGGTYINIEDLPNLGDADFGDVVLHTNFEMDDKTVASTAQLIDGAVEGIEYTTTSGLHGYTEEDGSFSFQEGDDVTFTVGGVTLGVATAEDVSSGKTFLQDIADVERTDLNDEYLENMATFLQSIDENSDAYDGIVITDEIREALADIDIDLRTASADEVKHVVEQVGKSYVEEDAAMEHVEDMLVDYTDLDHNDFQEHLDDDTTNIEQSVRAEQEKENQLSSVASTGFDAIESETAAAEVHVADIGDLSLNIPSLDLPGEEQDSSQVAELQQGESVQQETFLQDEAVAADTGGGSDLPTDDVVTDSLGHGLPTESLSILFDDNTEGGEDVPSVDVEKSGSGDNVQESSVAVEEVEVSMEAATAVSNEPSPVVAESIVAKENVASVEQEVETVTDNLSSNSSSQEKEDDTVLNTDDLHIGLDDTAEEVAESDNSLDSFSANKDNEKPEENSLDEFSATDSDQGMEVEVSALDELDVSESEPSDQVDDAGLNDVDAIQEDLSAEPDQIEAIGVG